MTETPFRQSTTSLAFDNHLDRVLRAIDRLENSYVLNSSMSELEQHFIDEASIAPLIVNKDECHIEEQRGTSIDVTGDYRRAVDEGVRAAVVGTRLIVALPYTGDKVLWGIRPSKYTLSGYPKIHVHGDRVTFEVAFPDDNASGERLKQQVEQDIQSLLGAIENQRRDVERHNAGVPDRVKERLAAKHVKALAATKAVAAIGIPMKRREAPATFTIPTKRRPSPISRVTLAKPFSPEPVLDTIEYDHILAILRGMALVIERNPLSFSTLDEEAIRDHFLLQLNGHYEGSATGETFNKSGKTDILIRHGDRNVFVAECKFWRGQKSFADALDQLLGYLTWRDCKCALIIFNRNRDSGAVAVKMREVFEARPEYRKTVTHAEDGTARYILVKPSEPGREIIVSTLLFDIPSAAP